MNQSSLLAEFGDPITRVENALIALKEAVAYFFLMMKIAKTRRYHLFSRAPHQRANGVDDPRM